MVQLNFYDKNDYDGNDNNNNWKLIILVVTVIKLIM